MIALHEILEETFPVRVPDLVGEIAQRHHLQMIGLDPCRQWTEPLCQIFRFRRERHEHKALPQRAGKLGQGAFLPIEIRALGEARRAGQATQRVISPMVIGTDQPLAVAAADRQGHAAMTTDVREGADLSVDAVDDDDRLLTDVEGDVVSRLRHFFLAADADPFAAEQAFLFEPEHVRVGIELPRHGPGAVVGFDAVARERVAKWGRRAVIHGMCSKPTFTHPSSRQRNFAPRAQNLHLG